MEQPQLDRVQRMAAVLERDGPTCAWCGRTFEGRVVPTTDHLVPRVKGGPSWLENEVAACRRCNGERGHRGAADWLEECHRRGWPADDERVRRVLGLLEAAIGRRGGQRRARVNLATQARRLRRGG
ncbi:HNH endonuclease [Microlunatus flavus]|uniref:HNH endonuclease n=1 Tax=Microlunatus flavus TaxID=1036181 RepID=A0A1H9NVW2_9ACTN|nr:HNH endonuclease [Microlunatus flavus]SER40072.1 HNH endonuclease [Microlunatus flavus]